MNNRVLLAMAKMNIGKIKEIIINQLDYISNKLIRDSIKTILVEPVQHLRKWDYSKSNEEFICWTIAIDNNYGVSYVYSEFGFGPETPWGLVSTNDLYFGMDSAWFKNLKECFLNSKAGDILPIWEVLKVTNKDYELIADNLLFDKAFELRDKKALEFPQNKYFVLPEK